MLRSIGATADWPGNGRLSQVDRSGSTPVVRVIRTQDGKLGGATLYIPKNKDDMWTSEKLVTAVIVRERERWEECWLRAEEA